MTHRATGSIGSPADGSRAPSRVAARLVVGALVLLVAQIGRFVPAAHAADNTQDGIFCGCPLARHLAAQATDTYSTSLFPGTVVSMDAIATDSGLLQLQSQNFTPETQTCGGYLLLTVPQPAQGMDATASMVNVTGCLDTDEHPYTITMSVVSGGSGNCGVPLPCGMPFDGTFATKGEVDSYTFPGMTGDTIDLRMTNVSPAIGPIRIRVYDPSGASIYDGAFASPTCPASTHLELSKSGTYTTLISKCSGAATGQYTVTWQPTSRCTAKQPSGQFAYVTNADSGTMSVVDLSSNTAKLVMPITPPGLAAPVSPTYVAITPNGGFAWATYDTASTASIVNTSTNLLMASVPTGLAANGLAVSPDSGTVYVVSNALGGISLVDTTTNKVTGVVAQDIGFAQGVESVTTADGTFLYVVSEDDLGLDKINTVDYMKDAVTPLDLGFFDAFAASPDGTFIYAGVGEGIVRIDTTTNQTTDSISLDEPFAIAFTPNGRTAYATLPDSSTVAVIDTTTDHVVASISNVGDSPGGIAINPDTLLAYVTDVTAGSTDPGVFIVDTTTNKVIGSLPTLGDGPTGIALTTAPTGLCVGNAHGQTVVTVDELILSVNYLLDGCPGQFPPMSVPFP
jgi:YVTN family beta-propeller protein